MLPFCCTLPLLFSLVVLDCYCSVVAVLVCCWNCSCLLSFLSGPVVIAVLPVAVVAQVWPTKLTGRLKNKQLLFLSSFVDTLVVVLVFVVAAIVVVVVIIIILLLFFTCLSCSSSSSLFSKLCFFVTSQTISVLLPKHLLHSLFPPSPTPHPPPPPPVRSFFLPLLLLLFPF